MSLAKFVTRARALSLLHAAALVAGQLDVAVADQILLARRRTVRAKDHVVLVDGAAVEAEGDGLARDEHRVEARRGSELGLERVKIGDLRAEVVGAALTSVPLDVAASASAPLAATAVAAGGAAPTARRMRASSAARSRCISSYTITWATGRRPSSRAIWSTLVWLFCDVRARRSSASIGTTSRRTARLVVAWLSSPWHDVRKNETACLMRLVRTIASTVSRGSSATSERRCSACAPPIAPKETPLARHGGRASDAFGQPPAQRLPRRVYSFGGRATVPTPQPQLERR